MDEQLVDNPEQSEENQDFQAEQPKKSHIKKWLTIIGIIILIPFLYLGINFLFLGGSEEIIEELEVAREEAQEQKSIADTNIALTGIQIGLIEISIYLEDEFAKERNFDDILKDEQLQSVIETSKKIVTDRVDFIPEFVVYAGKEDYVIKARIQGEDGFFCSDPSQESGEIADSADFENQNNCLGLPLDTDTDEDGIKDTFEIRLGTNPNNPDTDGDGYTDTEEINSGNNPLGQ